MSVTDPWEAWTHQAYSTLITEIDEIRAGKWDDKIRAELGIQQPVQPENGEVIEIDSTEGQLLHPQIRSSKLTSYIEPGRAEEVEEEPEEVEEVEEDEAGVPEVPENVSRRTTPSVCPQPVYHTSALTSSLIATCRNN